MVSTSQTQRVQSYDISQSVVEVEGVVYCEYGIVQSSIDEGNKLVQIQIDGISTEKTVVEELMSRLCGDDVAPVTLQYIVEDYLNEIFSL